MRVAFVCSYTPLVMVDAAGASPYRVLPLTNAQDRAGGVLHDNMCPCVKRILDRVLADDLPDDVGGVVVMGSCDAMRRLADAWRHVRPKERIIMLDLPVSPDERSISWFAAELERFRGFLADITGAPVQDRPIAGSIDRWNALVSLMEKLERRTRMGGLSGGAPAMQRIYNESAARPLVESLEALEATMETIGRSADADQSEGARVFLFGNVMPDPETFALLERCGARVAAEDLCTGSRMFHRIEHQEGQPVLEALARSLLTRPRCARTMMIENPSSLGEHVVGMARACKARGVIGHVVKFCDPYLARMPAVQKACAAAGLPLLLLEGDCTGRAVGQHMTRIEAFVEMMGGMEMTGGAR